MHLTKQLQLAKASHQLLYHVAWEGTIVAKLNKGNYFLTKHVAISKIKECKQNVFKINFP